MFNTFYIRTQLSQVVLGPLSGLFDGVTNFVRALRAGVFWQSYQVSKQRQTALEDFDTPWLLFCSLSIFLGQKIPRVRLSCFCWKLSTLSYMVFDTVQISELYMKTGSRYVSKIRNFTLLLIFLLFNAYSYALKVSITRLFLIFMSSCVFRDPTSFQLIVGSNGCNYIKLHTMQLH